MAKNKDRDPSEMILGTFRVKSGLWEQFKQLASDNNATATDLILSFIENCLQSESIPQSNLDVIPQSNLDDIYTYIDSKLDNTPSIQNIENLIDARISGSIAAGHIKDAIASSYAGVMGQFNGLLDEVEALKKQMEALKLVPPAAVPEQLNVECDRLDSDFNSDTEFPITADIASLLGIEDILSGDQQYDFNYLNSHIGDSLNKHKTQIEAALKIKLSLSEPKYICREFNKILRAMGYEIENKQIKKIETYRVVPK